MNPLIQYLEKFPVIHDRLLPLIASPTRRRLASGAFWGGIAAVGARVIAVGSSFVLARILGQQGFGEYGIINSTAGMIGSMAGMGIGQTVTKYVAELKLSDPQRAGRILALSSLVTWLSAGIYAVAFVTLAPWLAAKTLAAPHLASLLQISAITVALGVVNSVQSCSLIGCEAFKANSFVSVVAGIIQSVVVVLGAWIWGLKGSVLAMAMGVLVTVSLTWIVVRKEWVKYSIVYQWQSMWTEWRVLVSYSLPTFLILLFLGPVTWITNAFLVNQPNGYSEMGIFNAALQWQGAIQFLAGVMCTATIPVMAEKIGTGGAQAGVRVMKGMIKGVAIIALPVGLALCMFSPVIMRCYGEAFSHGALTMCFVVITGTLMAIMTPIANYLSASGMMWTGFMVNLGWVVSMLGGAWLLVRWGAQGLAFSRLLATLVHFAIVYLFVTKAIVRTSD